MPVDDGVSNPSTTRPFAEVLEARLSRRAVMVGGLATAAATFFASSGIAEAGADAVHGGGHHHRRRRQRRPLVGFAPVLNADAPAGKDVPTISSDYQYDVIIPWGSPLRPGGPDIDGGRPGSEAEALQQIGIGHDGMWFFPTDHKRDRGILCINHEFGTNFHVLGYDDNGPAKDLDAVRISQAVHGVSVVEIKKIRGEWRAVRSRRSRRITPNTSVEFDGPVAGSEYLHTPAGNAPAGTVNNCANGYTPWGTYLTCEENFNGYFGWNDPMYEPTKAQQRYGFADVGFGYGWHLHDERWDLSNPEYANEENRFGWIVEIDPMRPQAAPVKHTALGRVKHEGIALAEGEGGRIVGYMGDDERFDYIYKFVSSGNWKSMRKRGRSPLSDGTLYVARFNDDGTGDWLELSPHNPALAHKTLAWILVHTRLAADIVGATPMDRPEWTTVAPNGDVYCTLTNNSRRTVADAANPQAPNPNGHIVKWRDHDRHVGNVVRMGHLRPGRARHLRDRLQLRVPRRPVGRPRRAPVHRDRRRPARHEQSAPRGRHRDR